MTAHSVVKMRLLHVFPIEQDWMQLNSNGAGSFRCLHFCFLKEVRLLSDASCRTMGYFVGIKVALSKGIPEKLSESNLSLRTSLMLHIFRSYLQGGKFGKRWFD